MSSPTNFVPELLTETLLNRANWLRASLERTSPALLCLSTCTSSATPAHYLTPTRPPWPWPVATWLLVSPASLSNRRAACQMANGLPLPSWPATWLPSATFDPRPGTRLLCPHCRCSRRSFARVLRRQEADPICRPPSRPSSKRRFLFMPVEQDGGPSQPRCAPGPHVCFFAVVRVVPSHAPPMTRR